MVLLLFILQPYINGCLLKSPQKKQQTTDVVV